MNKTRMKWIFSSCILMILFIVFGVFNLIYDASQESTDIVIYHTNDMHGNVNSIWNDGSLSRIGLDMIKNIKDNTPNSILVDCGDAIWGTQFAKDNKGLNIINMMNATGFDVMALGNHEFDYGLEALINCVKNAKFPIISANTYKDGNIFLNNISNCNGENLVLEIAGKKIGFFAITTEETSKTTIPANIEGIEFKNEIEISKSEVKKLKKQNVDLIVAITHVGVDISSKITSKEIAKKVSGIDIIIDGHSHTEYVGEENGVVITQTGIGLSNLGKITIKFKNPAPEIKAFLMSANELEHTAVPDPSISKLYDNIYSKISPLLEKIVGKINNTLYGGTYNGVNISRLAETNMGDFICDAMLESGKDLLKEAEFKSLPIVAFENGGAVRSKISSGYIKMDQIFNIFPMDNRLSVQIITPKVLYQVLERGVGKLLAPASHGGHFLAPFGGFPQVSGIKFEVDPSQDPYDYSKDTPGKRIKNIKIINNGNKTEEPLLRDDNQTKIVFLFNDYGLYEFPALKNIEVVLKGDYLYNVVSNYVSKLTYQNGGEFSYPYFNERIKINKKYFRDLTFNCELNLKDDTGSLPFSTVILSIDNGEEKTYKADENSKIILENLPSGAHIIKLKYDNKSQEVYINNEIGMKNNTVNFTDKFFNDISSVSNLIGQIPYNVDLESENIIKFARNSYESLNNLQKTKVLNYKKLLYAEKELQIINLDKNNIISKINSDKNFLIIFSVFIILFCMFALLAFKIKFKIKLKKRP